MQGNKQKIHIGPALRAWQKECTRLDTRFLVLVIHRRAGKTELSLLKLITAWIECKEPDALFGYIAPELKQAKRIVWRRLKSLLDPMIKQQMVTIRETELAIDLLSNPYHPRIQLFGADNDEAIRGSHFDGLIVDEVANIRQETWEKALRPTLADKGRLGWVIFIGTPSGHNLFYDLWLNAQDPDQPDWTGRLYTVYQTDALDPAEIAALRKELSNEAFSQEFLCDWNVAGVAQFISLATCMQARRREYTDIQLRGLPLILGVDVARYGNDATVLYPRRGMLAMEPLIFRGLDNMSVAGRVANFINEENPDAVFIDAGGGAGVIDRLRELGYSQVFEVQFGSRADDDERFKNRRAEMWQRMKDWLELGGALSEDQIVNDLCAPQYEIDSSGKLKLESKADIKQRLRRSPDNADALALTFAAHVFAQNERGYKQLSHDYNPLENFDREASRAGDRDYR